MNSKIDVRENVLKKDSALVSINSCSLNTVQRKSINALLFIAKKHLTQDEHLNIFTTSIAEINCLCGFKTTDLTYIKNALRELQEKIIEYNVTKKNSEEWAVFPLLAGITINYRPDLGHAKIEFGLPFQILRVLKNPQVFAIIDLAIVRGLKNKYSIALYELARDYYKIRSKRFTVDELKIILGAGEKYKYFSMFEKRVLIPAINDVNQKTEFIIKHDVIKKGRKKAFIDLSFVSRNQQELLEGKDEEVKKEEHQEVLDKLKYFGVPKSTAKKKISLHGIEAVENAIEYTELQKENGNIKTSPAQCFHYALKEGLGAKSPYELEQEQKANEAQKAEKKQAALQERQKQLKKQYAEFEKEFMKTKFSLLTEEEKEANRRSFEENPDNEFYGLNGFDYTKARLQHAEMAWYIKQNGVEIPSMEDFKRTLDI